MTNASPKRRRWKTCLGALVVLLVGLLIAGELVARFYLGLGDPPLSMSDPEIEYLYQPSQDVSRFGNRITYNAYSMRSDAFPKEKPQGETLRVIVLGDSIVNGGSLTDQSDLATELLKQRLTQELGQAVQVGNVSTGSWGPGNIYAYLNQFGLFDADAFVLVLSTHDAADKPTFEPLVGVSPAFPDKKPVLALQEAVFRYLPRYLPGKKTTADQSQPAPEPVGDEGFAAIEDFKALVGMIKDAKTPILFLQHPEKKELQGGYGAGYQALADAADELGIQRMDLAPYLQQAVDQGQAVYRDRIHLNAAGQKALAEGLYDAVSEMIDFASVQNTDETVTD